MLIKKGSRFELYPYKVKYTQHGKEIEQWALPSKEWFVDFAEKWEHTDIVEFKEVELTEEQIKRYEQIKHGIPESFKSACIEYILKGEFPEGITHPLRNIELYEQQLEQDDYIINQDFEIAMLKLGLED